MAHLCKRSNIENETIRKQIINSLPRKSLSHNNLLYSSIKAKLKSTHDESKLDDKSSITIIEWLLDKDILRQGKTIKCNACFTENWISINRFNSKITCNGCANEITKPFGIEKIEWEYEINTLVSSEIDQGLLVHLLTGYYIIDEAKATFYKKNIYGSYYGVNFIKKGHSNETDIAFTVNGQLVIGECKISGREFTEDLIKENISFAKEINATKLIFSCLEHVEEVINKLQDIDCDNLEITILGKEDLLYQFPGFAYRNRSVIEAKNQQPINKPEDYKRSLEILTNDYEYDI
jgi:hypothetical protein